LALRGPESRERLKAQTLRFVCSEVACTGLISDTQLRGLVKLIKVDGIAAHFE
jgi:hypothetical protein